LKPTKGADMFPEIYSNIFICARKKSGKTQLIGNILRACVGRDTRIVIFASTARKDDTYKDIIEHFRKRNHTVDVHLSIKEDGIDNLSNIVNSLMIAEEIEGADEEDAPPPPSNAFNFEPTEDEHAEEKARPKRAEKFRAPEVIFVFDDLSTELRTKSVTALMKANRHFKAKVVVSSQWPNDLEPSALKQLDYAILFGGHDDSKLTKFHNDMDLKTPLSDFIRMYRITTADKFAFLYIDVVGETFRKGFNQLISNYETVRDNV
jgi:hypothetical protein